MLFRSRSYRQPFASQSALTQHIDKSPGCLNFLAKQALTVAPHGSSVMQPQKHRHEDANVAWTSNKRPALLRRHMVNDDVAANVGMAISTFASFPNLQVVGTTAEAKLPISGEMTQHSSDGDCNENDSFGCANDADSISDEHQRNDDDVLAFEEEGIATTAMNNTAYTNQIDPGAPKFRSKFTYTTDQNWTVSLLKIDRKSVV